MGSCMLQKFHFRLVGWSETKPQRTNVETMGAKNFIGDQRMQKALLNLPSGYANTHKPLLHIRTRVKMNIGALVGK